MITNLMGGAELSVYAWSSGKWDKLQCVYVAGEWDHVNQYTLEQVVPFTEYLVIDRTITTPGQVGQMPKAENLLGHLFWRTTYPSTQPPSSSGKAASLRIQPHAAHSSADIVLLSGASDRTVIVSQELPLLSGKERDALFLTCRGPMTLLEGVMVLVTEEVLTKS